jgi:hypothetical protein
MNENIEFIKSQLLQAENLADVARDTGVKYRNVHWIVSAPVTPRYMKKESFDALLKWAKKQKSKAKKKAV